MSPAEAKLPARDLCLSGAPTAVTHRAPLAVHVHLHPPLRAVPSASKPYLVCNGNRLSVKLTQTLRYVRGRQTLKYVHDRQTLRYVHDRQILRYVHSRKTLNYVRDTEVCTGNI